MRGVQTAQQRLVLAEGGLQRGGLPAWRLACSKAPLQMQCIPCIFMITALPRRLDNNYSIHDAAPVVVARKFPTLNMCTSAESKGLLAELGMLILTTRDTERVSRL